MLQSLKNIFQKNQKTAETDNIDELTILCGLMMEAANTDGIVTKDEINKISSTLIKTFKEDPLEVKKVLAKTLKYKDEPKSLQFFTYKINKSFDIEKKLLLIETLWEIILADGEIHDFESNLIRRLAGLFYISDVSCANAKRKALEKIKNTEKKI